MARLPRTTLLLPLLSMGALCDPAVVIDPPPVDTHDSTPPHDSDTATMELPVGDLSLRVDDTIESLVWLSWEQSAAATVRAEYGPADGEQYVTPSWELEAGRHEKLLLGVPYETEIEVSLVVEDPFGRSDTCTTTTGDKPSGVPDVSAWGDDHPEGTQDPTLNFLLASIEQVNGFGLAIASWTFVFDRMGRVVWALESPQGKATIHARISHDGSALLIDHNSFYAAFDGGAASQVARTTIDGVEQALYDTPGLHHPFTDTPDGALVYLATAETYDSLVRLDTTTGVSETLWACQPFQDGLGVDQYCTSNSVSWHEPSQRFLVSFYSSDTVVEIDPEAGQATRWFGHLPGAWGFEPEDSAFWWQHGAHLTDAGTLLLSTKITEDGEETVVREYELDPHAQLLRQVWSFGEGQGVYGEVMGEAWRLPGGNTLHNYGSATRVREITPDGEVVWEVSFSSGTYLGRTTPIADLYALLPQGD